MPKREFLGQHIAESGIDTGIGTNARAGTNRDKRWKDVNQNPVTIDVMFNAWLVDHPELPHGLNHTLPVPRSSGTTGNSTPQLGFQQQIQPRAKLGPVVGSPVPVTGSSQTPRMPSNPSTGPRYFPQPHSSIGTKEAIKFEFVAFRIDPESSEDHAPHHAGKIQLGQSITHFLPSANINPQVVQLSNSLLPF
ncbi:hypothetical protein EYC80_006457 [Monilinia laxa]|uniref:Uncharacterized protein n=1 Tax=Monilinia laxa TaxID=61186 RepID=A0A5N6JTH0_MONLA|nr:hypothetical protein EYC80_006457 [Monilinia laxa]